MQVETFKHNINNIIANNMYVYYRKLKKNLKMKLTNLIPSGNLDFTLD